MRDDASVRARILVVDDDDGFRALMRELLADEGYAVELCSDWRQAHARARTVRPDAIVLDVWLGGGPRGWDVLDALRADATTAEIPVLACSAGVAGELADQAAAHRVPVLAKPFELEDLLGALDALLGGE